MSNKETTTSSNGDTTRATTTTQPLLPFTSDVSLMDPNPEDILVPDFLSEKRTSPTIVASFNLLATIVGGGILSLPLVFEKCGILVATLLLILAAWVSNFSVKQLCLSSRRTGATSYGEVARTAYGEWMEYNVSALLLVFLLFVLVAYMVLIRDIWTPIVSLCLDVASDSNGDDSNGVDPNAVLLGVLIVLSPFLVQRTLYSLRYNCYIGFASVCILCLVLCYHGLMDADGDGDDAVSSESNNATITTNNSSNNNNDNVIQFMKIPTMSDTLFAFPIAMLSFMCHFNVVAIQEALIRPTRQRMFTVVDSSIFAALTVNILFGLGGYLYAGSATEGNILLNTPTFETRDWGFLLGRIGVGITIVFATPMILLPCRESLLELIEGNNSLRRWWCWCCHVVRPEDEVQVQQLGERTTLLRHDPIQMDVAFQNPWLHYGSTFGIVGLCYTGAVAVKGVAVVWSLCGCSMGILISFILPSAFFVSIEKQQVGSRSVSYEKPMWVIASWVILIVATLGAIVCTISTATSL